MTKTSFEAALEAARTAKLAFTVHTTKFRLSQAKLTEERERLNTAAIEAAETIEQVRAVMRYCPKWCKVLDEANLKLVELASTIEEFSEISTWSFSDTEKEALKAKWSSLSMVEVEAASNWRELRRAYERAVGPASQVALEKLTRPYRDCTSLEELEKLEEQYGNKGIMRCPYYDAYERLYKEKHGVMPTYSNFPSPMNF